MSTKFPNSQLKMVRGLKLKMVNVIGDIVNAAKMSEGFWVILSTMPDGQPSVIVDYIGVLAVLVFCLCRPCAAEKENEMPPREYHGGTNVMKASLLVFLFIVLGNVFLLCWRQSNHCIKQCSRCSVHSFGAVGVYIHGHTHISMPQSFLGGFRTYTCLSHQCRTGMTQVVKSYSL